MSVFWSTGDSLAQPLSSGALQPPGMLWHIWMESQIQNWEEKKDFMFICSYLTEGLLEPVKSSEGEFLSTLKKVENGRSSIC